MTDRKEILKKVNQPEERLFLAKVLDQAAFCCRRFEKTFTDFCDPAKLGMALSAMGLSAEYNIMVFGGSMSCERNMIGFCPPYDTLEEKDFPIKAVEIKANAKFASQMSHRDFLGSVLGLGIERDKVGDIFVFESRAIVFASSDIADYIAANLERVGRNAVKCRVLLAEDAQIPQSDGAEKYITVPSMRIDCIIGEVFNLSRSKASDIVAAEKVFINWNTVKNGAKTAKEGDIISVRGFGRVKIHEIKGKTKRDKIGLTVLKFM